MILVIFIPIVMKLKLARHTRAIRLELMFSTWHDVVRYAWLQIIIVRTSYFTAAHLGDCTLILMEALLKNVD